MFAAIDPRRSATGTPFENVAEEVLNGLFCHYEPPTSEYAQHKAATKAKLYPEKYTFSQVKKTQSILRTSRLFRKKQAVVEARKKKKAVTWRDEKSRVGIESTVESCAVNSCGFLGLSSAGDEGLADSIPSSKGQSGPNETRKHTLEPLLKTTPTSREPLKDGTPKKVLYDDEGNPISDDNSIICDENKNPIQGSIPPAPLGLSQLRKMARELSDDVYEPENYDQPVNNKAPIRSGTPRHLAGDEDKIELQRSQSPTPKTPPNHYDTPEQFEERRISRGRTSSRPGTPYRLRGKESEQTTGVEGVKIASNSASPSRRSEAVSDLTMDAALYGRNSYRSPSPATTSEGIEVDMIKGRARPRSRSPSRYHDESSASSKAWVYDDNGNVESRSAVDDEISDLARESLEGENTDKHTRQSMNEPEPPIVEGKLEVSEPRKHSRPRRISEPLPLKPSSRMEDDGSKSGILVVEGVLSSEEEKITNRRRDPTPRMSLEPTEGGDVSVLQRQGPLPPTPRQKDEHRDSLNGRKYQDQDNRHHLQRAIRERRQDDDERRTRLSRSREARITEGEGYYASSPSDAPRPKPSTNGHAAPSMYEWKYKTNPLNSTTPTSTRTVATDEEIRAEVSSVGMESNTLRPMVNYRNRFIKEYSQPPTIKEEAARQTSHDVDVHANTISHNTGSSHDDKPPHKKTRSKGEDPSELMKTSTGSGSLRTNKLWKGMKKAVGKVKQIVKDIDDQRIPPPDLSYTLQSTHPNLGR